MAATTSSRRLALDVLDRVLGRGQAFDETFAGHPGLAGLSRRDRAFARLLTTTVLRRLGQIDALLDGFLRRRPSDHRVHDLLRLGTAQLAFLGTPAHAAVGETVALATGRLASARGLANAVLRRVATEGQSRLDQQDAARLALPPWLWSSWCAAYGEATTRAIIAAQWCEPPLDLTIKEGDLAAAAGALDASPVHGRTLRRAGSGPIEELPGYQSGDWWVQDAAAALPARLLGAVAGRAVLDLGAAPGGKTAQLAAAGAEVTAVELSATRALRLRANLARLRLDAHVVIADALDWRPPAPAPFVLLDVPCTATGTIRRHPDIAWHKTEAEVARLAALQGRLLVAATAMLAPGGLLVYASCSLQPEEGALVVDQAAAELPLERVPIAAAEIDDLPVEHTSAGDLRTLPCHLAARGGLDGFFIARLRRRA